MATGKKEPSKRDLELQLAEIKGALNALGNNKTTTVISGKPVVGIRNVSSYTIGLVNKNHGEEGEISLHAARLDGTVDPASVAVISHQFWTQLRAGKLVQKGQIIRDDSICSDERQIGPADRAQDYPAGYENNLVADPFEWIESRDEAQLREDIQKMDSEPSLRRLASAVDHKIWTIGNDKYKEHPQRAKMAIRECPSKYHFVDRLVEERLDDLNIMSKTRSEERETIARFR